MTSTNSNNNNNPESNLTTRFKTKSISKTRTKDKESRKTNTPRFVHLLQPNNDLRLEERTLRFTINEFLTKIFDKCYKKLTLTIVQEYT